MGRVRGSIASFTTSALAVVGATLGSLVVVAGAGPVPVAHADGPGVGTPWVVSLGDSYISGEAGRWAGNSNNSSSSVDAGGPGAYHDNATGTGEQINRCHRSTAAEIHIGGGVNSLNLACSGARTSTFTSSDGYFKPGIDFFNSGGQKGQALMLQEFAATNNVGMIQLSIGGNNSNFADIVQRCVTNFLTSPSWWPNYCNDDSPVRNNFTTTNITAQTNAIIGSINNIRTLSTVFGPYYVQESIHPNWWGQKALRNCVRQAYNNGTPRGGTCTRGTGLNANAEPNMTLT